MSFLGRFSPIVAVRDLRGFLATRERYEFVFLPLAIAITAFLIWVFVRDSHVEPPYVPHIIYVQNWRADRTDAEIHAQQRIDQAERDRKDAVIAADKERNRQAFQRLDRKLTDMGF